MSQRKYRIYGECDAVYLAEAGNTGAVKVGRSANPARRCLELQTSSHVSIRIVWAIRSKDAIKLERAAHQYLKANGRHLRGEWFEASSDAVRGAVEAVAKALGIETSPDMAYGFDRG